MIFDDVTWLAFAVVLTAIGAVATVLLWRRRGPASGVRALAWTLLPVAAYLTGTLRLFGRIADAIAFWATRLVLSPTVWAGLAVAGVAAALFAVAAGMRRHGVGSGRAPTGSAAAVTRGSRRPGQPITPVEPVDDGLGDIEAILKKHGIS